MKHQIYIDFEYNSTNENKLNLVSASLVDSKYKSLQSYWLYKNEQEQNNLRDYLFACRNDAEIVCYNSLAEGRSFIALGLNPSDFTWVDLMYLWKQLKNSNHKYQYGEILSKKGKPIITSKKPREMHEDDDEIEEDENHSEAGNSLASCIYGLFKEIIDTEHKTAVRDIIISNKNIEVNQQIITKYNESDLDYMPRIYEKTLSVLTGKYQYYLDFRLAIAESEQLLTMEDVYHHSKYVAELAIIENNGIPIRTNNVKQLSANYTEAVKSLIEGFMFQSKNSLYFWNAKTNKYVEKYDAFKELVDSLDLADKFPVSGKTKKFKKDDDTLEFFGGKYPIFEEFRQVKKALNQLKWYRPEALPDFINNVGSDNRLRCYFNPYGTQTGRNAPPAKQFIFAQSSWLRAMIQPPKGKVIIAADWKSQEFMLAAWKAKDAAMKKAYESGDIYVAYGLSAGLFPNGYDKTNDDHKRIRNKICKPVVLGIGYGMGAASLAKRIDCTEEEAAGYIAKYYDSYPDYFAWKQRVKHHYRKMKKILRSADNWLLLRDNPNDTSVLNFPIQGSGASCLRYAIRECLANGLKVISPLHDAIYFECDEDKASDIVPLIKKCMQLGVNKALKTEDYTIPVDISIHKHDEIWVEEKGKNNFELLRSYCNL